MSNEEIHNKASDENHFVKNTKKQKGRKKKARRKCKQRARGVTKSKAMGKKAIQLDNSEETLQEEDLREKNEGKTETKKSIGNAETDEKATKQLQDDEECNREEEMQVAALTEMNESKTETKKSIENVETDEKPTKQVQDGRECNREEEMQVTALKTELQQVEIATAKQ